MAVRNSIFRLLAIAALSLAAVTASADLSWYDAAGALSSGPAISGHAGGDDADGSSDDGAKMRETVETIVSEYDKIGAGPLVRQCMDASRIVEIAENPTGIRELVFLLAGIISLVVALFVTKHLAGMFHVEIAKLLWIPIVACFAVLLGVWQAWRAAAKHKFALAGGIALSAVGVVSVVDPVRHAFFDLVSSMFLGFAAWYVPLAGVAISLAGLLFVAKYLVRNLGDGGVGKAIDWVFRNAIGLVVIPFVCACVFLGVLFIASPIFDRYVGTFADSDSNVLSDASKPFSAYSRDVRVAAAEMARAAELAYDGKLPHGAEAWNDFLFNGSSGLGNLQSWKWTNGVMTTPNGTVLQVYRRTVGNGIGEIIVVFRGTASLKDGLSDLKQLFGDMTEAQYDEAAAIVRAVRGSTDLPIVVLGHSLGGGQAQYAVAMNVAASGVRGVGFNSAGLSSVGVRNSEMNRGCSSLEAAGAFSHVRMDNDPVSSVGILLGNVATVTSRGTKGFAAHSITALAQAMERTSI